MIKKVGFIAAIGIVASQALIYAVLNSQDAWVYVAIIFIWLATAIIIYNLVSGESYQNGFEAGLSAVKDGLKIESLVQKQLAQSLRMIESRTKASTRPVSPPELPDSSDMDSFAELEISGL